MSKMNENLRTWLNKERYGNYNGHTVSPETEIVKYTYVTSLIKVTITKETRYYFKEIERGKAFMAKLACILYSLICGWWGLPHGPIKTIQAIIGNIANDKTNEWKSIAGYPGEKITHTLIPSDKEIKASKPKKKKLDIIIYIIIGAIIGALLIWLDLNGQL